MFGFILLVGRSSTIFLKQWDVGNFSSGEEEEKKKDTYVMKWMKWNSWWCIKKILQDLLIGLGMLSSCFKLFLPDDHGCFNEDVKWGEVAGRRVVVVLGTGGVVWAGGGVQLRLLSPTPGPCPLQSPLLPLPRTRDGELLRVVPLLTDHLWQDPPPRVYEPVTHLQQPIDT